MDDNNIYDIPRPLKYKKWNIWPETVLDKMEYYSSCKDTIEGVCLTNKTLEECIDECGNESAMGYYIKLRNGDSICVPIRTDVHPYLNPVFRLRNKNIYKELKNIQIFTFIDSSVFKFPPDSSNLVFYNDILTIKDTKFNNTLGKENIEVNEGDIVYLDDKIDNNITLIPDKLLSDILSKYIPVRFGTMFNIFLPGTSLKIVVDQTNSILKWKFSTILTAGEFMIVPVNHHHKINDIVSYNDEFHIIYKSNYIVLFDIKSNYLFVKNKNIKLVKKEEERYVSTFKFISKMTAYYCDEGKCKSIPMTNVKTIGNSSFYKNHKIISSSNPFCFGICKNNTTNISSIRPQDQLKNNDNSKIIISITILIIIILMIIIIIFLFYHTNKYRHIHSYILTK